MAVRAFVLVSLVLTGTPSPAQPLRGLWDRVRAGMAKEDAETLKRRTWTVGETKREALVVVPASGEAKRPVIFAFHGHGGTAEFAARQFAFHKHWPEAIVVYPQGLPTPAPVIDPAGAFSGWQKYVGDQSNRDLDFFDAILKSLQADHRIDDSRIYVAGHSNGGYFAYLLGAARGDKLAALAPIAAAVSVRDFKKQTPLPTFHVAGEQDKIVPYATQERTLEQIRKLNGCDPQGKSLGGNRTEYPSARGTPLVTLIHSGGHNIPREAPEQIASFFKEHARKPAGKKD